MSEDADLDREIMLEFLVEVEELLAKLDQELVELEDNPQDDVVASVFRSMHTIKGSAGFLGLSSVEAVAHEGEALLAQVRAGNMALDSPTVSSLLHAVDLIRAEMVGVRASTLGESAEAAAPPVSGQSSSPLDNEIAPVEDNGLVPLLLAEQPTVAEAPEAEAPNATATTKASDGKASEYESIRVDVGVLDELMNVVSELVLTRNQLRNELVDAEGTTKATLGRLSSLTSDLQTTVMKTRMQPISHLFGKYPRVVRDLSLALGKSVRLDVSGGDTELDRALIDAFRDPLTHLVRNAIDHGVETPQERINAGKDPAATLTLAARHESGHVVVSISDDGAGVNFEKIKARAIERGILTPDSRPTLAELANTIFAPGFSTADTVTNVSGRGVGMDVVKTQIEAIGGSVSVEWAIHTTTAGDLDF